MNIFQKEIILNTNDVDFQAKLSIPAIMRHFQVIAADHTNILEVDHYSMIEKSNAFWVITKLKFEAISL
ncbi:MAG: thioesterase, partial [Bacilli bacterium]|nr:thioesterase [Bacilli bacterium]